MGTRQLAQRGMNLVLVARRKEQMDELAREIRDRHEVETEVLPCDLARPEAPSELHRQITGDGRSIDVLVNNAGFGLHGSFTELGRERQQSMLQLNIMALTHLTWLFARDMRNRRSGRILQVASIGAFQPTPT